MSLTTSRWARLAALVTSLIGLLPVACGEDDPAPAISSRRGESCRAHADCSEGLACVNHVCTVGRFNYAPTGMQCVRVECRAPEDCCGDAPDYCPSYKDLCDTTGDLFACQQYESACVCDANKWACEEDQCVEICSNRGAYCQTTSGTICDGSRCVECLEDNDCLPSQICTGNECVTECKEHSECPYFHECQSGACVEVGCVTNRECIAYLNDVTAICDAERECQVPCASDLECDSAGSYGFKACINRLCQPVGCLNHEECRILLRHGTTGREDFEAECRQVPADGTP